MAAVLRIAATSGFRVYTWVIEHPETVGRLVQSFGTGAGGLSRIFSWIKKHM